ncbi:hypothetical protein FYJ43_02460 [Cutibacterium sp. WCA-380-WT-3A]|uniref:Uncharacterized protein n=1 Tax=Cutibacterium porci TaxID=2605781 RepID=A0A7K0J4T6_9ACTN|nr:hypothetical protein [Cutibacterium porci]MSS44932.1 hypothetical protein [Cutibacterium porci]
MTDPLSRILDAGLELARQELDGRVLDDAEVAALDFCDDMGAVRWIAVHEAGGGDEDEELGIPGITGTSISAHRRRGR